MVKYVNKDKAVDKLMQRSRELRGTYGDLGGACAGAARIVEEMIDDVVEVGTARWQKTSNDHGSWYQCSHCLEVAPIMSNGDTYFSDYCPSCGFYMEGND